MNILKRLKEILTNAGYREPIYENYQADIVLQNSRMVHITSFIGSVLMILLTVASLKVASVSKVLPLYFCTAIVFLTIHLIVRKIGAKNGRAVLICNYLFLTAAFFFAIGLDIIQRNPTATTVCVLLVALPLLIVDKPYRESIYFAIIAVLFMFESVYIKQSPKASLDVLNAVSFFIVGDFLGYKHNQMMLRNIRGHYMLQKERDTDALTGLYNKAAIEYVVGDFLKKENVTGTVIVIDMDNFKFINDTYGHHAGDKILTDIARVLSSSFRSTDYVSRFGGDEFTIFLPMTADKKIIERKAKQVLEGASEIRIDGDPNYRVHLCMGIATYPEDGNDYDEIFRNADKAMYYVKKNGKNGFAFFDINAKKKILLVDDVEVNRAVLKSVLESEFQIFEAEDGQSALALLAKHPDFVMVITDIQMPNMDGIELIKQIRAKKEYQNMAIIANTQYGDLKQEEELFCYGVDDFVYKPSTPKAIQIRVKNVLKIKEQEEKGIKDFLL